MNTEEREKIARTLLDELPNRTLARNVGNVVASSRSVDLSLQEHVIDLQAGDRTHWDLPDWEKLLNELRGDTRSVAQFLETHINRGPNE